MPTESEIQVFQDFTQGDDFIIKVTHNPIVNLEGGAFEVTLKAKQISANSAMSVVYSVPNGTDAQNGIANIPITATDTAKVAPGKYYASIKRILTNGDIKTLIRTGNNNARKVTCYRNLRG